MMSQCVGNHVKIEIEKYSSSTSNCMINNKNSLCFTLWIHSFCNNFSCLGVSLPFWILLMFVLQYETNLLLFDNLHPILIQFHYHSVKQVTLNVIKRLLSMITLVLIGKNITNNFQSCMSFVVNCFQLILQSTFYIRLQIILMRLLYSIANKINMMSFIASSIGYWTNI